MAIPYPDPALETLMADLEPELVELAESLGKAPPVRTVEVALITAQSVGCVAGARGQVWVRVGSRRAIATAQDERILNERHRHLDAPFDARPVSRATLADLDVRRFEKDYLLQACGPELAAANNRTTEERLAATGGAWQGAGIDFPQLQASIRAYARRI
ncbi:MAG: hypothetical protein OXI71_15615 [Gemmatimonadota bacterium]|nr:hypothetical protein [Gemmatimonadota bacterium]MDE2678050.1 hypothetical protein [Gemmatimonadota bacterium]